MIRIGRVTDTKDGAKRFNMNINGVSIDGWRWRDGQLSVPAVKTKKGWYHIVSKYECDVQVWQEIEQAARDYFATTSVTKPVSKCFACANPDCAGLSHSADCPKLAETSGLSLNLPRLSTLACIICMLASINVS